MCRTVEGDLQAGREIEGRTVSFRGRVDRPAQVYNCVDAYCAGDGHKDNHHIHGGACD